MGDTLSFVHPEGARVMTAYTLEIFAAEFTSHNTRQLVSSRPENRWLTAEEVHQGFTNGGEPVSTTVRSVLDMLREQT